MQPCRDGASGCSGAYDRSRVFFFWLYNAGLVLRIALNFFLIGWPQLNAVFEHGFAYARSVTFYNGTLFWQWMRFPGDVVFAVAALLMSGLSTAPAQARDAGTYYSSCTKLHVRFKHGVAKGPVAAQKQVNQGYGRPAYGTYAKKVYWANYKRLDRDRDGTACER